jgi:Leucine-rich repeat (LRR) protein
MAPETGSGTKDLTLHSGISDQQNVGLVARNLSLISTSYVFQSTSEELKKIVSIDLSQNQLSVIRAHEFSSMINVVELNLGHNQLKTLQQNAFAGLIQLTDLILAGNQLSQIPADFFAQLPKLLTLFLDNNNIIIMDADIFITAKKQLYGISIAANPWDCNFLKEMWSDFETRRIKILDLDKVNVDVELCGKLSKQKNKQEDLTVAVLVTLGIVFSVAVISIGFVYCVHYK